MGNANIDPDLKKKIENLLLDLRYRTKYQNLKGFIDNACYRELELVSSESGKKSMSKAFKPRTH